MKARRIWPARYGLLILTLVWLALGVPVVAFAAPYAAMVVDARSGEVLHARNADTRLHPASLTKMMTLYIAFEAVKNGEISLDTKVRISRNAAAEPPSKLGLKSGQRIALRYLIRAAAVKSANDAATAIGEAIEGSEAAFARRMNRTAKALGMSNTTFKNAHGLTESGHLSTARDMTTLGRHLLYDYPQYYNLFSRRSTSAGIKTVNNTNRRLLDAYKGADGIKTGYTRAAGFNLVASAERGNERVIATVFGGRSTASRNAKVAELLDLGFKRAPSQVALRKPAPPAYQGGPPPAGKTVRVATAVTKSLRPKLRPVVNEPENQPVVVASAKVIEHDIQSALLQAQEETGATLVATAPTPPPQPKVVTRLSTSGGRHWGINVGRYASRYAAEKVLLKTALAEMATLDGTLRKVVKNSRGYEANFMGMTQDTADLACRRLQARQITCYTIGPS
ncbi:D-alanyl-D-alanine carboxypeptidase family protein [Shimia aestuarii]|uniref:D-alanyl-D-alanine carboxypeptidase n=1 Tax=Shimia aestuarii TaxID=254406 RepID=A0A1I4I6H8_9RHOB|nr:D-alanyl-D-alanine carboxypeptidase family protein [Shimia aestuarii]SFL49865.1 D-alanyl-D-alanine carboxypeptidase [Shimia aestuarii]